MQEHVPVALQLGSSPVGHQLHQNIVYIENFQFIYPVNILFFSHENLR